MADVTFLPEIEPVQRNRALWYGPEFAGRVRDHEPEQHFTAASQWPDAEFVLTDTFV